jgi:hypothetical protein
VAGAPVAGPQQARKTRPARLNGDQNFSDIFDFLTRN